VYYRISNLRGTPCYRLYQTLSVVKSPVIALGGALIGMVLHGHESGYLHHELNTR
jgi:hypothetical protein